MAKERGKNRGRTPEVIRPGFGGDQVGWLPDDEIPEPFSVYPRIRRGLPPERGGDAELDYWERVCGPGSVRRDPETGEIIRITRRGK